VWDVVENRVPILSVQLRNLQRSLK
jgi:hypothetical protein